MLMLYFLKFQLLNPSKICRLSFTKYKVCKSITDLECKHGNQLQTGSFKTMTTRKQTPLMRQYNEIKEQYPGTILFFRVGDFYETFSEDAILVSKELGITLTKRNNGGDQTPLAGFPFHALNRLT